MKGNSWPRHLNFSPMEIGKSFDELCKENVPPHSLDRMEWYRTISNKQESPSSKKATPEVVTASNDLKFIDSELAPSKSGPVPNFKSLQERQVNIFVNKLQFAFYYFISNFFQIVPVKNIYYIEVM